MNDDFFDDPTDPDTIEQDDGSTSPGPDEPIDESNSDQSATDDTGNADQSSMDDSSATDDQSATDDTSNSDQSSIDDSSATNDQSSTEDTSNTDQSSTDDSSATDDTSNSDQSATGDNSSNAEQSSTDEGGTQAIHTQHYEVAPLQQPSGMTCWATVATMMISWQDSRSYMITAVMDRAGTSYRSKFDANQGLPGSQKTAFLNTLHMRSEPPQDYAVVGFQHLIENYGPLWVTTDESPDQNFAIHARIVTGMDGDGSVDGTMLTIVDPADGQVHTESYTSFTQKFDKVATDDMSTGSDFRVQVVHF